MRKVCRKCNTEKDILEFYRHSIEKDGHTSVCKDCIKIQVVKYAANNKEKVNLRARKWRLINKERVRYYWDNFELKNKEKLAERHKLWRRKNIIKARVHSTVGNYVRRGDIIKRPCVVCGEIKRVHGHHNDYSKPLDIVWLCPKHHIFFHKDQVNLTF
jgi:hypothetical protein